MKLKRFIFGLVIAALAFPASAKSDIVFNFNWLDANGVGFNQGAIGETRKNALQSAAVNFGRAFSSYNATIVLDVKGDESGDTLMSAGTAFDSNKTVGFGFDEVIRNKILMGTDLNGASADGQVSVNFNQNWELDINTTPISGAGGSYDWYSTAYHEFAHAFGFLSGVVVRPNNGNTLPSTYNNPPLATDIFDGYADYDPASAGVWSKFDEFITDKDGNRLFAIDGNLNESLYASLLVGGPSPAGGLFYTSVNAGGSIGLYTPTTYSAGSSGSHLDDQNPALAGLLMLSSTPEGPSTRLFSSMEQGIFKDLGYTNIGQISAIPEPGSLAMLGLAMGYVALRRKKSV